MAYRKKVTSAAREVLSQQPHARRDPACDSTYFLLPGKVGIGTGFATGLAQTSVCTCEVDQRVASVTWMRKSWTVGAIPTSATVTCGQMLDRRSNFC